MKKPIKEPARVQKPGENRKQYATQNHTLEKTYGCYTGLFKNANNFAFPGGN